MSGRVLSILIVGLSVFFTENRAQIGVNTEEFRGVYLLGTIDRDGGKTGLFSRRGAAGDTGWFVFVGEGGWVYKLGLIGRDVSYLYIDGTRIADGDIWRHTAAFRSNYDKYWRDREIEAESDEIDERMKPLERRINAVAKEMEKLDIAREKLERAERFSDNDGLDAQIKKLQQKERELDREIETLAKQQDKLGDERESLGLMKETDKVIDRIALDLVALGAIKGKSGLSYKLSNAGLIINGKPASPEIFELLRKRYIADSPTESGFLYRWKTKI